MGGGQVTLGPHFGEEIKSPTVRAEACLHPGRGRQHHAPGKISPGADKWWPYLTSASGGCLWQCQSLFFFIFLFFFSFYDYSHALIF